MKGNDRNDQGNKTMNMIYKTIRKMGVNSKYKGYYLLADAVKIRLESKDETIRITKDIYPFLARKYKLTSGSVDHNLRTVSQISWDNNPQFINEIAGFTRSDKFTNSEMVNSVAEYIDTQMKKENQTF